MKNLRILNIIAVSSAAVEGRFSMMNIIAAVKKSLLLETTSLQRCPSWVPLKWVLVPGYGFYMAAKFGC